MKAPLPRHRAGWQARLRYLWLLLPSVWWLAPARGGARATSRSSLRSALNIHLVLGVSTGHVGTRSLSGEDPALRVLGHVEFGFEEWYPFPPSKHRRWRFPDDKFGVMEYPISPAHAMAYAHNSTWTQTDEFAYFEHVVVPKVRRAMRKRRRDPKRIFVDLGHTNVAFMNGAAYAMVHHRARIHNLGIGHVSLVRIRRSRYEAALSLAADRNLTDWDQRGWPGWDLCRTLGFRMCPYEFPHNFLLHLPRRMVVPTAANESAALAGAWFTGDHMCDEGNNNCACDWDGGDCQGYSQPCEREAKCLAPPQHSCNATDDPNSVYHRWRSLSRFQQALYMIDEIETRWRQLVNMYGGSSDTNGSSSNNNNTSSSTPSAPAPSPAVSFHSLNWGGDSMGGAVSALAAFLNGNDNAPAAEAADGSDTARVRNKAHASSQLKETFRVADAQTLDRAYQRAVGLARRGSKKKLLFDEQVATLATGREQVLFQSSEYNHGLGTAEPSTTNASVSHWQAGRR